ncbi:MAG: hypothetical protein KDK29_14440 [Sedimentitalea sp.]|nr:hypothetical protein [Sedimentitalea sp.]
MGGQIFIEAGPVPFLGLPLDAVHLYLVHRDTNGTEYVLRAGPENTSFPFFTEMLVAVNQPLDQSRDARGEETPADRHSTLLEFPALSVDAAWALMVRYAARIEAADYDYRLFAENSNAFVGALLGAAGGQPEAMMPTGIDPGEVIGLSSFAAILADITAPADGSLRGTALADTLTGIQVGETILAFAGDDIVFAGRGDDLVRGGAGDDRLHGQVGFDRLHGGAGNDRLHAGRSGDPALPDAGTAVLADRLFGGGGQDRLFGSGARDLLQGGAGRDRLKGGGGDDLIAGGAGSDILFGGAGADEFRFAAGGGARDVIRDFEDGIDRIRIEGITGMGDLDIAQEGADTVIGFGAARIVLRDTDATRLDGADFLFEGDAWPMV